MRVAAVDIGTNSTRLLIVDERGGEIERRSVVTGLGRGVDSAGRLGDEPIAATLAVLGEYRRLAEAVGVGAMRAVATSAARDATDVGRFLDAAQSTLALRPEVIGGEEEARLSYRGAVAGLAPARRVVVDIGGGSTELVTEEAGTSINIGSVRLTERCLPDRPARPEAVEKSARMVSSMLADVAGLRGDVVGVAGTWTSLAALAHARDDVHHARLWREEVDDLVVRLAALSIPETAALPHLDPARAPVILAGAIIAAQSLRHLSAGSCLVSVHDLLDGVTAELLRAAERT